MAAARQMVLRQASRQVSLFEQFEAQENIDQTSYENITSNTLLVLNGVQTYGVWILGDSAP